MYSTHYRDRIEAGQDLADIIQKDYAGRDGIVLAIPRGGVPVGVVVAERMKWPLDVVLIKKLPAPGNPEFAIGSVSLEGHVVNTHIPLPEGYVAEETARLQEMLLARREQYMGGKERIPVAGKVVIIVDDGMATGNTVLAAVELLKAENAAEVVVAVPVAPDTAIAKVEGIADRVICPMVPEDFFAVGQFYDNFEQTTDEEVMQLLQQVNRGY